MEIIKKSLKDILEEFNKIIIPYIQRDYVMGSGGTKLELLLTSMLESIEKKDQPFNFSCLVGYKDQNNYLYVYDGQQRVASLVYLCAYLMETNTDIFKKFSFYGRDLANLWLENPNLINKYNAVDFTTYSLANLLEEFNKINNRQPYGKPKISFEFLLNNVIFDMILVDKISDAEQFFLDINDGLDLKNYEVFKAELFHHASSKEVLGVVDFKKFALKMENEWIKFFLPYSGKKNRKIDGRETGIDICEEEMLVHFIQYCFRMMWVEENGNDTEYKTTDVNWLTKEHLTRFEYILDAIIKKLKNESSGKLSCISYQKDIKYCKGQHWNISDKNYVAMLKTFLSNVYDTNETKKDVVIWCYISRLLLVGQAEDVLYKYMRFVKKILNNNRKSCNDAFIKRGGSTPELNRILYVRYYVLGIPQYYTQFSNKECDNNSETFSFLNSVICLNKKIKSSIIELYTDDCIKECENKLCRNTILKEIKKQNSKDKDIIQKYEDLTFINGLVDNFLSYTQKTCKLHEFCNDKLYSQLSNIKYPNDQEYKDILQFITQNKIDLNNILFSNIKIYWQNYFFNTHNSTGYIVPHTWCDLFTSENGLPLNEKLLQYSLHLIPDGWVSADMTIMQPAETMVDTKNGFAAHSLTNKVWNIIDFHENFSCITFDQEHGFLINGHQKYSLKTYLYRDNIRNWMIEKLNKYQKVYFSDKPYLNEILQYLFEFFNESNKKENIDVNICFMDVKENVIFMSIGKSKFLLIT